YLITVFPFLFWGLMVKASGKYRLLSILLIVANIFSLYVSYQRGAWVAFFVSITTFQLSLMQSNKARMQAFILALFLCIGFIIIVTKSILPWNSCSEAFQKTTSPGWRIDRWQHSLKTIIKKPIIGTGFGQYSPSKQNGYLILYDDNPNSRTHAHNTLLNIGLQLGIPGLLAFLSMIWILCASALKKYSNIASYTLPKFLAGALFMMIVGCMTRNMFDDFFIDDTALLFWFIAGMCMPYMHLQRSFSSDN
ncbi:MAG: O-antigen ligase family protein, partial [Pseudomonadota bacterium]